MNIVYLLENKNKTEGRRFYIGSKQDCAIEVIDGIPRIISLKTGLPYYGSSTCMSMKDDMAEGHAFSASLLENVPNKKLLLGVENKWIKFYNAVDSPDFYNKGYATVGIHGVDQFCMYNPYGETIVGYGKSTSSMNRRQNTAMKYGFKNTGEFSIWLACQFALGYTSPQIALKLNWERHAPRRYICDYNMLKCITEYNPNDSDKQKEVRDFIAKGASIKKIAEILALEIPTVCLYVGDYNKIFNSSFLVAQRKGYTKEELEVEITTRVLQGQSTDDIAKEFHINETSCKRYFMRCVRRHLKPEDLKKG